MKPGDILFVRTDGIIGGLIRWLTRSSVNHVALAIDEHRILEVQPEFGVKVMENPYRSYVRGYLYRPLTHAEQKKVLTTAAGMIGRKYDWSLIGAILFRLFGWKTRFFRDLPCRWICTEAVDFSYLSAGIDLIAERGPAISPEDLLHSPLLRFTAVREGVEEEHLVTVHAGDCERCGQGCYGGRVYAMKVGDGLIPDLGIKCPTGPR